MHLNRIVIVSLSLILFACEGKKADSPNNSLREYVSRTFAIDNVEDRDRLIELTTGNVKEILLSMDEEDFRKNFLEEKKAFVGMKIKDERELNPGRYSITYELTYTNKTNSTSATVLTKKHAIFEKIEDRWLISEVQNLKTVIEHENEMSF